MYKFIRYFNQNRKKIIRIIVVIVFGFILLQFINRQVANKSTNNNSYLNNNTTVKNNININSAIGGGSSVVASKTEINVIEQFIQYCNTGKTNEAYNLLSNECKENMYPTLEYFIQNYYKGNFETSKNYNIQSWIGSIYKVDLKENILHTGIAKTSTKQDYITIVYKDGEYKLNINNYIGRTELNKQTSVDNLEIKIVYKDTYMNYETYTFEIKNNGDTNIYLDDLTKTDKMYIVDENKVKHVAYSHEIAKEQLHIYPYVKSKVQIKFSNSYVAKREYPKIVFENAIFNDTVKEISVNL